MQPSPASATLKAPVERFAPHPQFQCLCLFVQLVPIHPIPRPSQNRRPFLVRQLVSVATNLDTLDPRWSAGLYEFLRRAIISICNTLCTPMMGSVSAVGDK